jgi:hypothetical protein
MGGELPVNPGREEGEPEDNKSDGGDSGDAERGNIHGVGQGRLGG